MKVAGELALEAALFRPGSIPQPWDRRNDTQMTHDPHARTVGIM